MARDDVSAEGEREREELGDDIHPWMDLMDPMDPRLLSVEGGASSGSCGEASNP
jgi:hypothetical protein